MVKGPTRFDKELENLRRRDAQEVRELERDVQRMHIKKKKFVYPHERVRLAELRPNEHEFSSERKKRLLAVREKYLKGRMVRYQRALNSSRRNVLDYDWYHSHKDLFQSEAEDIVQLQKASAMTKSEFLSLPKAERWYLDDAFARVEGCLEYARVSAYMVYEEGRSVEDLENSIEIFERQISEDSDELIVKERQYSFLEAQEQQGEIFSDLDRDFLFDLEEELEDLKQGMSHAARRVILMKARINQLLSDQYEDHRRSPVLFSLENMDPRFRNLGISMPRTLRV